MSAILQIVSLIWQGMTGKHLSEKANGSGEVQPNTPAPSPPAPEEFIEKEPEPNPEYSEAGKAGPIIRAMKKLGYAVFEKDDRDLNLNIVGIRDLVNAKVDEYRDTLYCFWKYKGEWECLSWPITTFPGSRYLVEHLLNSRGAAMMAEGQYRNVYKLDIHNGKYQALCQRNGAVTVYRDGNRDRKFDLIPSKRHTGWFGINIHAPITPTQGRLNYIDDRVYSSSGGCHVFKRVADFLEFRALLRKSAAIYGNQFTYTLLRKETVIKQDWKHQTPHHSPTKFEDIQTAWKPKSNTTGVRNKNILNVKGSGWRFSLGRDKRGHNIFPSYEKGLRAGIKLLSNYRKRHGLNTIASILSRWAPSTDTIGSIPGAPPNSPAKYSKFVAGKVGIAPTSQLDCFHPEGGIKDPNQLYRLVSAMVEYENKAGLKLPRYVFDGAVDLL